MSYNASSGTPLVKVLVEARLGSRRKMAEAIKQGLVTLNGQKAESYSQPVNTQQDKVTFGGKPVELSRIRRIYLMLNKPPEIVSTTSDELGRKTVMDLLHRRYEGAGLFPVGRLDEATTGLLLLTNDGELTNRLTHPSYEIEKEYLISIDAALTQADKESLEKGMLLDDGLTSPARLSRVTDEPPYNYKLIIHEGKKRIVRRMFAHLGYQIKALKRSRIATLRLGKLEEGKTRELTPGEIAALKRITRLK
jgi:pseudouridine synthase